MPAFTLLGALALLLGHSPDRAAQAVLDTAIARMGGIAALRDVKRAQLQEMIEWQRTSLDARPHPMVLSYELSTELRDYTVPAWRYSRRFFNASGTTEVVDLVRDSVAAVKTNGAWRPQNVAYVTERDEVFTFAPERLLPLARDAADARALGDTVMNGVRHARVTATVGRFHPTLYVSRADGTLSRVSFRAAQPDDFGLSPWGAMTVDLWFSRWARTGPGGLALPMQVDVHRVGRPYKRMTILSYTPNAEIPADSLAFDDSLRSAFLAGSRKPMYDLPMDSARIVEGTFATFGAAGTPAGAVKVGGRWLVLEAGSAPLTAERSAAFLRRADSGSALAGALLTATAGSGGAAWLVRHGIPTWVTAGARPYVDAALRGWGASGTAPRAIAGDRWIRIGSDSLRVETVDLPDYPGATIVYVPSLRWAYSWPAASPLQAALVAAHARRRGWTVERIGNARAIVGTPPAPASAMR